MAVKVDTHIIKGITHDISISKANPELAFDARNIRLTAREGSTLLSITNERGNAKITLSEKIEEGTVLGYCVINKYLVLFIKGNDKDYIYRITKDNDYSVTLLYVGELRFDAGYPIECLGIYETEEIQKVYWVDGKNPVRFINIATDKTYVGDSSIFNFVRNLKLTENITITCNNTNKGMFPSGTVQYAFTYYNKFGAESNIVYQSPLYYSHMIDRGGSPEEIASNSFDITLSNLDDSFEYIRIYSIVRSSIDGPVLVKRVADLKVSTKTLYFTDTNTTGETVDTTFLLFVGGENIIPECMTQKDNHLFLGNYKLESEVFPANIKDKLRKASEGNNEAISSESKELNLDFTKSIYSYTSQLSKNSYEITTFKRGEWYRLGVQFQSKSGVWSEVLWIGDYASIAYNSYEIINDNGEDKEKFNLTKWVYKLNQDLLSKAIELGYVKVRGMVVYPSPHETSILCQGILNPTVFKKDDREKNSPYAQSSWFFRPLYQKQGDEKFFNREYDTGSPVISTDMASLGYKYSDNVLTSGISRSTEIGADLTYQTVAGDSIDEGFYVDSSIVTMHSPDIEFSDVIDNYTSVNLECKIIGYISLNNGVGTRDIQVSTLSTSTDDYGFYKPNTSYIESMKIDMEQNPSGRLLISSINWIGKAITGKDSSWEPTKYTNGWLVSPWQRSGSLINDFAKRKNDNVVAKLQHNRLINTRVSLKTALLSDGNSWSPENGISKIAVFNESTALNYIGDTGHSYEGKVDKAIIPGNIPYGGYKVGYTYSAAVVGEITKEDPNIYTLYTSAIGLYGGTSVSSDYINSKEPISMKYNSSKHIVFEFNNTSDEDKTLRVILPSIENMEGKHSEDTENTQTGSSINVNNDHSILWLAELSREIDTKSLFGGDTEEALLNNRWQVAGDPVFIVNNDGTAKSDVTIEYLQGDTYFQRYDCLKTYPYSLEDENNVTEILSFCCETRVNLDGRYDKNRRNYTNLALSPNNFNKINPAYSQSNNYFNYYVLDSSLNANTFANSIAWSQEKHLGEEVDAWTNINTASSIDLDGNKGEITALKTFNNEIFCFQKEGLSNILFNSRVQIPASDGVPIEITNGLKVNGKRYISSIGCTNKWSIVDTPSGLYFIDDITKGIYLFNGSALNNLSNTLGFNQWVKKNSSMSKWNPATFNNFKTSYDKVNRDVYFINKDNCLCYSELLGQFTSFYSYEGVPYMFNIEDSFYSIKDTSLWEQFKGDYNKFYDKEKPYSITYISNPEYAYDKIFNNIEFRADTYEWITKDKEGKDIEPYWELSDKTFDTIQVENEYQNTGEVELTNTKNRPSKLKRKFRIWRVQIPRDMSNGRDRIRNTWAKIKLEHKNPGNCKTELHDLMVYYFI